MYFRFEITNRMAPLSAFAAWTSGSSLFERASDVRNFEVSVQDRALVSNYEKKKILKSW